MSSPLRAGDLVVADLPEHRPPGHEQQGRRPALVVGLPDLLGQPRFRVILVAPVTSDNGQGWARRSPSLYVPLPPGAGRLPQPSLVLLDQIRALDVQRVAGYVGSLRPELFQSIGESLRRLFGAT